MTSAHGKTRLVATLEGHEGILLVRGAPHEIRAELPPPETQRRHDGWPTGSP
jgi:hypothetical protein